MKYFLSILIFISLFYSSYLSAQSSGTMTYVGYYSDTLVLSRLDSVYQLSKEFIIEGSESISIDSTTHLIRMRDYGINYRYGQILFSAVQLKRVIQDTISHRIIVTVSSASFQLQT